jgi:hypothetical protein
MLLKVGLIHIEQVVKLSDTYMRLLCDSSSLRCQHMDLDIHLSPSANHGTFICVSTVVHLCAVKEWWLQYQGFHICWAGFMLETVIVVQPFMTLVYIYV